MPKKVASKRKGGAPEKVPGGLKQGLFVRVNSDLMGKLDQLTEARSQQAGVNLSKADVARGLISKAMVDQMTDDIRREKRSKMDEIAQFEEGAAQSIMREHLTDYFLASNARRLVVLQQLKEAEREDYDLFAGDVPCGQWRHKWPDGLRKACLALWSTPKEWTPPASPS